MKHVHSLCALALVALTAVPAFAQAPATATANPIAASAAGTLAMVKGYIMKSAEQVPESLYGFKPVPEVRTFGQLFGHIADANYMICATIAGEKSPAAASFEKTATTKADLTKALAGAFAYCEKVYAATADADGAKIVDLFGMKMAKLAALGFNTAHDFEHYGNLVTYLRLNKMVPPSSQGRGM
jgi:uncharacterized damage-inducible protein DinB